MDKKNFFDSRLLDEPLMTNFQNYIEEGIKRQTQYLWGQVIKGLEVFVELNTLLIKKGEGVDLEGERFVLKKDFNLDLESFSFQEKDQIEIFITSHKIEEGTLLDEENQEQPDSLIDSFNIFLEKITFDDEEEGLTKRDLIFSSSSLNEENKKKALRLGSLIVTLEPILELNPEEDVEPLFALVWKLESPRFLIEEQIRKMVLLSHIFPVGSTHYLDTSTDYVEYLIQEIESKSPWRLANGQSLPENSFLRSYKDSVLDLRDKFIRSWDGYQNIGREQKDAMQKIEGAISKILFSGTSTGASGVFARSSSFGGRVKMANGEPQCDVTFDSSRVARTAEETRPKNIMLLTFQLT